MCEITVIAIIFLVAIEFNCKDLFNAKHGNQTINKPVQRNGDSLRGGFNCGNMDSCENLSILCVRKRASQTTKKVNAVDGKNM